MDIISFNEAATANGRIEKVIAQPDSVSGLVTMPSVVATGEVISIPSGRTVVHPNLQVDGTLDVQGTLFIPSGGSVSTTEVDATVVKQNGNVVANDSAVVHNTGNETIAGVKTFTSSPIVPNATTATQAIAYGQAVKNTGNETIAGVKTFSDNVGIGVTPGVWAGQGTLNVGNYAGNFNAITAGASGGDYGYIGCNFGTTPTIGVYNYQQTDYASAIDFFRGGFKFKTAPLGTAGNPITWNTAMTLGSNGNLLVGTTTDNGSGDKLQVNGNISTYGAQFNLWNNGTLFETINRGSSPREFKWYVGASGSAPIASLTTSGVWTNASDKRNKVNIKDIHYGLDTIMSLSAKEYDLKSDGTHGIGFIAQEVKNIIPELVFGDEDNSYLTLDYASMVTVLTKAVQEQQAQIEELKLLIEGKQNGN